jgi:glycosyltransferase involved in cell wall biosynthesis
MRLSVLSHSCVVDTNQQLYAALEAQGVTLQLIVPEAWRDDMAERVLRPTRWEGLRALVQPVPVHASGSVPLHVYRADLRRWLYLFQPDAVYCENESYALSTFQAALANRFSVRRPFLFRNNQNLAKQLPWPFRQAERFVLGHAACANLINAEAGQLLRAKGYKGRMAYMPYGLDPELHHPMDARELRAAWGSPGFVFGYVGRLVEEKGLRVLLEAFARLHPESDAALVVLGDGPLRGELAQRVASPPLAGRVRWLPAVPHREVPRYLSALDVLVLPSLTRPGWKEQFGRVIIEAAACGTPVIGSDSGEIPHLITRLGAGLVVPEGQPEPLARAMAQLQADPVHMLALRERGRREVVQQFAHDALAYRFRQLLESLVRDGGAGPDEGLPAWLAGS